MTTAWYWHLRYKEVPLLSVILISWGLAFVEYCLAVPANRYGNAVYSAAQLKTMQEVITLLVFAGFSFLYLEGAADLEPGHRLCADRGRRVFRVSQVVRCSRGFTCCHSGTARQRRVRNHNSGL